MRVASEFGQPVDAVIRQPFARTLWSYGHLLGADRRERLLRRGEQITAASNIAIAFHEPKKLQSVAQDYNAAIGMLPTRKEAVTNAKRLMAEMDKVHARLLEAERAAEESRV